jgi:alcohol dehydrogenase class IV
MPFARPFHYQVTTEIDFGPGALSRLGEAAKRYSDKVFLSTMTYIPAAATAIDVLRAAGLEVVEFDMVPQNPRTDTIEKGAAIARESRCGVFVGLGGGSSMDTAKAVALRMKNPGPVWQYTTALGDKARPVRGEVPPIIAVPTTAGTGSEVSQSASITNPDTRQKSPIRSPLICPVHAIIDPEVTVSMNRELTASTGFEAFCLSFEKLLAPRSFPFVDAMAEEAMRGVVRNLRRAMDEPRDLEARSLMMWESTQGGLCDLAGLGDTGLHAFSLPLSALFDLPRGEALAACMPIVLPEFARLAPDKVAHLHRVFAEKDEQAAFLSARKSAEFVIKGMNDWLAGIGLNKRLGAYGIRADHIRDLAASIDIERLRLSWGREVSLSEIQDLYRRNL